MKCWAFALITLVACRPTSEPPPPPPTVAVARVARAALADSTIQARDYIGPEACAECHPVQGEAWRKSLHARMNQRVPEVTPIGDFSGVRVAYAGGTATFAKDREGYTMALARAGTTVRYRVTRTIGVARLQEYVGRLLAADGTATGEEVRLPFAWWARPRGWYPQPYFDPWFAKESDFDAYAPVHEPWAERCPWCHSTYPFAQRIARASARPVGHGLEQLFVAAPGTDHLALDQQVTTGISCESCHLGGRAHRDGAAIHFVPLGATPRPGAPVPTTFAQERADPEIVNRVCAQCHSGPSPRLADGTSTRNSSEALDLAASSCTTARCVDCHDPHTGGSDQARAVAACTTCHDQPATHGGHTASTTCLDCHMPRMVMGIDRVVRTHRISSPTNAKILASAGPNACNLCHVDRSMAWTLQGLRDQYNIVRTVPARAYGDLELPVGEVWLASKEPALRLLAADAYAKSPLAKLALPSLVERLADPLPHLRMWTQFAIETASGHALRAREFERLRTPR